MDLKSDISASPKQTKQFEKKRNESTSYTLDEALELAGHGRFNIMIVLLSGLVMMGATIENISLAFVLPYADCDLNMTMTQLGLASSIPFLGIVISSHFWGLLADNPSFGRKKVIRLCATCALIFALLSAFSVNASSLIVLRFLVGIFISGLQASVFPYVSEFHTKETAPRAASFVSMFMPIIFIYSSIFGLVLIPLNWKFSIFVIEFVPWRLFIIVNAIVNAVNTITFIYLPESPKFSLTIGKHEDALKVLRNMYAWNTRNSKKYYPVKYLLQEPSGDSAMETKTFINILKLVWNQTKPIFIAPYLDSTVKLCFIVFTLFAIGHGIMLWLPDFLMQLQNNMDPNKTLCDVIGRERTSLPSEQKCHLDNSDTTMYQIMLCLGLVYTFLSGLISFYLEKVTPKILVPGWLVLSAACSLALNFFTEFHVVVVTFITFQSCSVCATIVAAISVSIFPTNVRAMASCFIFMFGRIGGMVGANLVGALVENRCNTIFNIFGLLAFSCAFVFLLIKGATSAKNPDDSNRGTV